MTTATMPVPETRSIRRGDRRRWPGGACCRPRSAEGGAERILVVDREPEAGGILWQCIHAGFGLHHFKEELTGPEYATRFLRMVEEAGIEIATNSYVLDIAPDRTVTIMSGEGGLREVPAKAVVLAMGARERTRGAIRTAGTRPAGVFTAGLAQKFTNMLGYLPGKRVVILGSGDIGLIMARRLTLEGAEVLGVFEIMPYANGLNRNIVQCLHDFDIPLHLSTTVAEIHCRERVEAVTVAPVDENLRPILDKGWRIECDTLLLAIGLIPENELSQRLNLRLDPVTGGPVVNSAMETSVDGIFACGNVVHIHDLVDFVTQEALLAGRCAENSPGARGDRRITLSSFRVATCATRCPIPSRRNGNTACTCGCGSRWSAVSCASERCTRKGCGMSCPARW